MRCPTLNDLPPPPPGKTGWPWTEESPQLPDRMPDGSPWPRISIVTPSYNQGQFIEETIRSVLLQGYPDLGYIVIDGGSTDDSVEIIRKYEPWLAYWVSETDRGQSHALNKGFILAKGDVCAYINSDDVYCKDVFAYVAGAFFDQTDLPLIINFSGFYWDESGNKHESFAQNLRPYLHVWLSSEATLFQQSTFWTSELHEKIGGFNEELSFCMDKEFFLKAVFEFGTYKGVGGRPVAGFRLHSESKTSNWEDVMWKENVSLWQKYRRLEPYAEVLANEYRYLASKYYLHKVFLEYPVSSKIKFLVCAAYYDPRHLTTRFFWGAVRKTLLKGCPKTALSKSKPY